MATTDLSGTTDFLALHQDFLQRLGQSLTALQDSVAKGTAADVGTGAGAVLDYLQRQLAAATAAKDQAIQGFDDEIRQYQETIARLSGGASGGQPAGAPPDDRPPPEGRAGSP
jgi:hypothetical protein